MNESSGFSGNFGGETQFVGANKNTSARIIYYLKKRHTFGKMRMEVQDMEGNKMLSLSPGKSKGINIVTWNFNILAPKMAEGKTMSFGGFTSPRVPAGNYKIVLTKGKKIYEQVIEIKYDEKSIATIEQRNAQEEMTRKLYNMVEDLAFMVYEINSMIFETEEVIKDHPKGKKKAEKLKSALETLIKDLVITTGDNYVASAEPELREKMGTLYSGVATSYDRVSGAQQDNFELISESFEKAKAKYQEILNNEGKKFNSFLEKNSIDPDQLKSKEEFLKKN